MPESSPGIDQHLRQPGRPAVWFAAIGLLLLSAAAFAQDTRLEIGVAGNVVVGAWNPLRLVASDVPPGSVLNVTVDQGSLRSGSIPAVLTLPLAGGGGVSVVESSLYLPNFNSIAWSVTSESRVVGSGSLAGREQDARPLDLIVSRQPGRFATSFPGAARVVDLNASELPLEAAAYDGVRSLIIDGTGTAPRLEAIAAAATGGAVVVLHGALPGSHAELELLVDGPLNRLGAGAVATTVGAPVDAAAAVLAFTPLDRDALIEAVAARPLVEPPAPASQVLVLTVAAVFGLVVLALLRLFRAPGLVAALLLAGLLSFVGWRALRPTESALVGSRTLALAGGALALSIETREYFTLPSTVIDVGEAARPYQAQPYRLDRAGFHADVPRWRSLVVVLPGVVSEFPLNLTDGALQNLSDQDLEDVIVMGLGPQGRVAPGGRRALAAAEEGPLPSHYQGLTADLPAGSVIATSGCPAQCTIWLAPAMIDVLLLRESTDERPVEESL